MKFNSEDLIPNRVTTLGEVQVHNTSDARWRWLTKREASADAVSVDRLDAHEAVSLARARKR